MAEVHRCLGNKDESGKNMDIAFKMFNELPYTDQTFNFYNQYRLHLEEKIGYEGTLKWLKSLLKSTKRRTGE